MNHNDLLEACKELRDACAVLFQLVADHNLAEEMETRFLHAGLRKGFGVRAQQAIAKAETEVKQR